MPATRTDRRTREQLLEAAAKVFAEKGFQAASVDEIARRAGFSKGAVYWHFESKDDLFFELLEERLDGPLREAVTRFESAPAEVDMAPQADVVLSWLVEQQRDLVLLHAEYCLLAARDPRLRARYTSRQAELRRAYARAIEARFEHRGDPPPKAPEDVATTLIAAMQGLALEKLVDPEAVPSHLPSELHAVMYAGAVARARTGGE
ncbi:MAG TPA: TetR family transcriptional regulator [Thermoleophilaceae bacterium]|jgi:AcrR family transcriptional regulator